MLGHGQNKERSKPQFTHPQDLVLQLLILMHLGCIRPQSRVRSQRNVTSAPAAASQVMLQELLGLFMGQSNTGFMHIFLKISQEDKE